MSFRLKVAVILAVLLSSSAMAVSTPHAVLLGTFPWKGKQAWFGGFSALEMAPDGGSMTVLSDRSTIATARVLRDGDQITSVQFTASNKLRSSKNKILSGRAGDSEGLVVTANGDLFISFEGVHRVAKYDTLSGVSKVLPRPKAFRTLAKNGSFESLAMDGQGRLYTMPEANRDINGDIPVYRWDGRRWSTPFSLPATDGFLPVGADFDAQGRLYVLERGTSMLGFRSQLRRWTITNAGLSQPETLLKTGSGVHDNLEGVSIWRDDRNRLRATMVSDDNFLFVQRTELVEYVLPN